MNTPCGDKQPREDHGWHVDRARHEREKHADIEQWRNLEVVLDMPCQQMEARRLAPFVVGTEEADSHITPTNCSVPSEAERKYGAECKGEHGDSRVENGRGVHHALSVWAQRNRSALLGGKPVLRELDNEAVRSSNVRESEPRWFSDRLAQYANSGSGELRDRGIDVRDAEAEVGDTETMAVRSVSGLGWWCRGKPTRKTTKNQDLPAE